MKNHLFLVIMAAILIAVIVCGCSNGIGSFGSSDLLASNATEEDNTDETVKVFVSKSTPDSATVATGNMDQIRDVVNSFCRSFLTFTDSPLNNIEDIKDLITKEYSSNIENIMGYYSKDEDYSQAVAVNKLYFSENPDQVEQVEVACLCFQNTVINETSSTISTFYVFKLVKDPDRGWLIDSVDNYRDMIGG